MKRPFRLPVLAAALLVALFAFGCSCGEDEAAFVEIPADDFVSTPEPVQALAVQPGDYVYIRLHVFTARGLFLAEKDPVELLIPADSLVQFDKSRFVVPNRDYGFPFEFRFEVPRVTALGAYEIRVPMKLRYSTRADGTDRVRNELLKIPLKVENAIPRTPRDFRYPIEYLLE